MKDRITEFELDIEFSKAAEISQEWAMETKYIVHETTEKRILYTKKHGLSGTQWVSIERLNTKIKLSAWFAPTSLGPDQEGSFWRGNKQPIPTGVGLGPIGHFKKQFNNLLDRINSKANNTSVNSTTQTTNPPMFSKENFSKGLVILAVIVFVSGALSVLNGSLSMYNQLFPDFSKTLLQNGIIDMIIGVVLFSSARLLKNGKALSIWLYGATLLFSVGQDLASGAKFPFITVLFGVWIMSQLLGLKKQGQLA